MLQLRFGVVAVKTFVAQLRNKLLVWRHSERLACNNMRVAQRPRLKSLCVGGSCRLYAAIMQRWWVSDRASWLWLFYATEVRSGLLACRPRAYDGFQQTSHCRTLSARVYQLLPVSVRSQISPKNALRHAPSSSGHDRACEILIDHLQIYRQQERIIFNGCHIMLYNNTRKPSKCKHAAAAIKHYLWKLRSSKFVATYIEIAFCQKLEIKSILFNFDEIISQFYHPHTMYVHCFSFAKLVGPML